MGRGADDKATPVVGRRNPFRQEILDKSEFDRAEAERKQREVEEEERRRREEAEALTRAEEAEHRQRVLELEQERDERRAEKDKEEQARIKKREDFLRSRGLEVFDPNSPADRYVEMTTAILPEEYPIIIERIDDPLLQEDGKNFVFSVRDDDKREEGVQTEKGFAESEEAAQEIIDAWIEADIAKKIEELKEREAEFLKEQSYERQKAVKEKIIAGLNIDTYLTLENDFAKLIFDKRTTDLSRQEISGFDVLTYKVDSDWQIAVFRKGRMYLTTSANKKLVPVAVYQHQSTFEDPIADLPARREERELAREAVRISEEKHGAMPFAGGLPGITKGRREQKEKRTLLREEARKEALEKLKISEEERIREEMVAQAKVYIKNTRAELELNSI